MTMTPPLDTAALPQGEGTLYRVLHKLISNQASGKLIVHNPQDQSVHWRIYLGNGRIHYAGSEKGQRERLSYLLQRYIPERNLSISEYITDDYQYLCDLWQAEGFSFQQIRSFLAKFTQEALIQILSQQQSLCYFESTVGLEHLFLYLDLKQLMSPAEQQIRYWLKLRREVSSPFQRPMIVEGQAIASVIDNQFNLKDEQKEQLKRIQSLLGQHFCLYEIANRAGTSTLNVALMLQPLLQAGVVKLESYNVPVQDNRPVIACVDDSPAIQRVVKFTLEASGFRVVNIKEPFKALTTLLHTQPALILMDINMPDIDGYQLCSLCNKSSALKDIPIVMLTGRSGLLDRVKAKMVGSVGYISKPFLPQELVETVNTFISLPSQNI